MDRRNNVRGRVRMRGGRRGGRGQERGRGGQRGRGRQRVEISDEIRGFFPRCLRRENIACDVDEVLWPDPAQRQEEAH